jgi:hypothetical protein
MIRLLLLLLLAFELSAKIRILTFHFNQPQLIEIQDKALKKFLLDDYEVIVFNDADNEANETAIRTTCEKLGFQCIRFEQDWHRTDPLNDQIQRWIEEQGGNRDFLAGFKNDPSQHPSIRHSHVIQFALDRCGYDHDDALVILDGDCFPIRPISIRQLLTEGDFVGIELFRAPFIAFYPQRLPDVRGLHFSVSFVDGSFHDTGGACQHYLRSHPSLFFKEYPQRNSNGYPDLSIQEMMSLGFTEGEARICKAMPTKFYLEFLIGNHFIHLGSSVTNLVAVKTKLKHIFTWIDFK